jgi:hypothetical protein
MAIRVFFQLSGGLVNWDCLVYILGRFGFEERWNKWVILKKKITFLTALDWFAIDSINREA